MGLSSDYFSSFRKTEVKLPEVFAVSDGNAVAKFFAQLAGKIPNEKMTILGPLV